MRSKRGKIIIAIFGILIIVSLGIFQDKVKNFFYLISLPPQKVFWKVGDNMSDFLESISKINNLKKENEELRRKIQKVTGENVGLRGMENENKILREALNAMPQNAFEFFISQIASRDIINSDLILIKGGSEDGILEGMPVITPEKILVGKISKTYGNFSKVTLISNKDFSFNVKILKGENPMPISSSIPDEVGIYGLARGKGNFEIYLDKVLLSAELKEGDSIITASLGGTFPEGILVGEIRKVKKSDLEPFQQAEISPFFALKDLGTLFIITKW